MATINIYQRFLLHMSLTNNFTTYIISTIVVISKYKLKFLLLRGLIINIMYYSQWIGFKGENLAVLATQEKCCLEYRKISKNVENIFNIKR